MIRIKPYFRSVLSDLGYKEHKDTFDYENIKSKELHKAFFVEANSFDGAVLNQDGCLEISGSVLVRAFVKGKNNPYDALNTATAYGQAIVLKCLETNNRTTNLKNVLFNSMEITPLSESNNDDLIININFTAEDILAVSRGV
jgi:hypothetical protein